MPVPHRPIKSAGNANYADEVTDGTPDIIDTEVDADFNTLYETLDGKIDDDNINAKPFLAFKKIVYDKLNLTGRIVPGDLVSGFVFPPGSITGGPGGSIGHRTITVDNLQIGASFQAFTMVTGANRSLTPNVETVCAETTWKTRGGVFFIFGMLHAGFTVAATGTMNLGVALRLQAPDSGTAGVVGGSVLASQTEGMTSFQSGTWGGSLPGVIMAFSGLQTDGSTLRAQLTGTSELASGLSGMSVWEPNIFVVELA